MLWYVAIFSIWKFVSTSKFAAINMYVAVIQISIYKGSIFDSVVYNLTLEYVCSYIMCKSVA